ncbi:response regulator transcription factor [Roseateles koreensis]|uniref:Response regulator transcription factor n=1 Tax=Roseateles koreensis TaxID=2987526 RepID=A0ABT5KW76_9BURK|nr:response regulator transcription factor [Roseateles koreensis]MDC8787036.1 response regulator transcription factor [Roseateles koreensis]
MTTQPTVRILLVEDDERLAQLVVEALRKAGYDVTHCINGQMGESLMLAEFFDVILLDGHLPGKDGFDVLRDTRSHVRGRIVMLTARDDDIDQVLGLEGGADDYITKPVAPRVLLARIKALLRRDGSHALSGDTDEMVFGPLVIKRASRDVRVNGEPVELTTAEYDLLIFLAERAGSTVSRDDIMQGLRGIEFDGLDRAIDARVSRLRKKIGDQPQAAERIKTVRGQGYLFAPD